MAISITNKVGNGCILKHITFLYNRKCLVSKKRPFPHCVHCINKHSCRLVFFGQCMSFIRLHLIQSNIHEHWFSTTSECIPCIHVFQPYQLGKVYAKHLFLEFLACFVWGWIFLAYGCNSVSLSAVFLLQFRDIFALLLHQFPWPVSSLQRLQKRLALQLLCSTKQYSVLWKE